MFLVRGGVLIAYLRCTFFSYFRHQWQDFLNLCGPDYHDVSLSIIVIAANQLFLKHVPRNSISALLYSSPQQVQRRACILSQQTFLQRQKTDEYDVQNQS